MRCILLFFITVVSTYAYSQTVDEEKVNALHKQKFEWLIAGNIDSLNALLAPEVNYIHSNGWIQTREEVLNDLKNGRLHYKVVEVEHSEVSILENTAIVTGRGTFSGVMNGNTFSVKLLYTEVYVKASGRWKLIGRQATKL